MAKMQKKSDLPKKYVKYVAYHSPGGKSGRETGQKLNSAVRDVREQAG